MTIQIFLSFIASIVGYGRHDVVKDPDFTKQPDDYTVTSGKPSKLNSISVHRELDGGN